MQPPPTSAAPAPQPGSFAYLYAQLPAGDESAHERGVAFERIVRWLLAEDPVLALDVVAVHRWEDWDDRFHPTDIGIDFVVVLRDGRLMAVQAKAWSQAPGYRDLGTFWAASQVPDEVAGFRFARRLLICPPGVSDRIPPAVFHAVADTRVWDAAALEALTLVWPSSLDDLDDLPARRGGAPAGAEVRHELRSHQRTAADAVVETFAGTDRAQLVMACGTGKTLVGQRVAERVTAAGGLVVVAAPSLALLAQLRASWVRDTDRLLDVLPVCSEQNLSEERHEARTSTHTTDVDDIAAWLRADRDGRQPVVFATYHSLERVAEAMVAAGTTCALLVCDEAHRLAGRPDRRFRVALDADAFPAAKRLFATATPRIFELARRAGADGTVASMGDEAVFGPVAATYSFADAVRDGRLADYQLAVLDVDVAAVRSAIELRELAEVAGREVTAELLSQVSGTVRSIQRFGLRRVVVFHHSVRDARAHAALLAPVAAAMGVDTSGWWAEAIVGQTGAAAREARLERLRATGDGQVGVVTTARVLTEGIDVPALDAVVFADPRSSQVDVVQAVGRVMRVAPGKTVGHVIVPVPVDRADPSAALTAGRFAAVGRTLAALAAHDPLLRERLNEVRRAAGRRGGGHVGGLGAYTGGRVQLEFSTLAGDELVAFVAAVEVALVDKVTVSFEFWLGLLEAYVAEHGTADLAASDSHRGYDLGGWLHFTARRALRDGTYDPERVARLRALPGWVDGKNRPYKTGDERRGYRRLGFDGNIAAVTAFVAANGRLPRQDEDSIYDGAPLAVGKRVHWIRAQGRKGRLTLAQIARVETIPQWVWNTADSRFRPTPADA